MAETPSLQIPETDDPESYANEVIKCLFQMRDQRERNKIEIQSIESEKQRVQIDIRHLTNKLAKLNYRLAQKTHFDSELKKTIEETETAYSKLLESSQILYNSVKQTQDQLAEQNNRVEKEKYPRVTTSTGVATNKESTFKQK